MSNLACFNLEALDLTSSRKRGLSGMKMIPTSAASAGKRHTKINNLQLCIWNSVPMLKPQPERPSSKKQVIISRTYLSGILMSKSLKIHSATKPTFVVIFCILKMYDMHQCTYFCMKICPSNIKLIQTWKPIADRQLWAHFRLRIILLMVAKCYHMQMWIIHIQEVVAEKKSRDEAH